MTATEAEEKRKTCKLCLKKPGYSFCKRHAPRVTMSKVVYYDEKEFFKLKRAILYLAEHIEHCQKAMPDQYEVIQGVKGILNPAGHSVNADGYCNMGCC